jgi:glycosyltransferase involved in cell wall biosynthesis
MATVGSVSGPVVEVLLSTWRGERHLTEQVDSILAQQGVRVRLLVRDDGSDDRTLDVLATCTDPRLSVVRGGNLGLPQAYFRMLEDSGDDADLWALADQDDVWLPHKLARAAEWLASVEGPALYCARVLVVDRELRPLYPHPVPRRGPSFANALVQNIATGCTVVLNREARAVLRGRWPSFAVMHDAWMYLVLSGTGCVHYDSEVVVHYRQHDSNAVGMGRGAVARVIGRVRRQLAAEGPGAHGRQNRELMRTHADLLHPAARRELEDFLAAQDRAAARLRYAVLGGAHRQTRGSDLVLKGLQVLGRV